MSTHPPVVRSPTALSSNALNCRALRIIQGTDQWCVLEQALAHVVEQLVAFAGDDNAAHSPIGGVDRARHKPTLFEPVDDCRDVRRVVAQAVGELALGQRRVEAEQRHCLGERQAEGGHARVDMLLEEAEERDERLDNPALDDTLGIHD